MPEREQPRAYYNEIDKQKAAWLRELISRGEIAPGDVDERSIADVRPDDLRGYRQCHFFAGVGIWSYALRLAGWSDDREVWTGSCPCPSFSAAGKGEGFDDPRHLWPVWLPLIGERRPPVVFGEQADAAIGHGWLDLVSTDLEASAYAVGAAVLGACSVGAPHRRQRLYLVADSEEAERGTAGGADDSRRRTTQIGRRGLDGGLADYNRERRAQRPEQDSEPLQRRIEAPRRADPVRCGVAGILAEPDCGRRERRAHDAQRGDCDRAAGGRDEGDGIAGRGAAVCGESGRPGPANGFWRDADWIFCRDRRWRPVEAGTFPLAYGAPARMGRLRGYGDGIVAEVAAEFIRAYMEIHSA